MNILRITFKLCISSSIRHTSMQHFVYPYLHFYTDPYPFRNPSIHLWRTRGNSKSQILCQLSLYPEWFHAGAFRYNMLYLSKLIIRLWLLNISPIPQKGSPRVIAEGFMKKMACWVYSFANKKTVSMHEETFFDKFFYKT